MRGSRRADPNNFDYSRLTVIQGVPAGTKTAKELNLGYPAIELAKITIPASTATITNAMITDPRRVAQPKTERELLLGVSAPADLKNTAFAQWPKYAPTVSVPPWATWVKVVAHINGAAQMGKTFGEVRLQLGNTLTSASTAFDINSSSSANDGARVPTIGIVMSGKLPAGYAGTNQVLQTIAKRNTLPTDSGYLTADGYTHIEYDVWFQEVAS